MTFSDFGARFRGDSGTSTLMRDLAVDPHTTSPQYRLGGGNPANLPAVDAIFRNQLRALASDENRFSETLARYPSPKGDLAFITALTDFLNRHYAWSLTPDNVVLTNGSQNAFFLLFNLLGGTTNGLDRHILLPVTPEYIGYEDVGISGDLFRSHRPIIDDLGDDLFKYRMNPDSVHVDDSTAAICVSRPTNPTGNVLTDVEIDQLDKLASTHQIPLIIDNAYGSPFPNIIHVPATIKWHSNIVLSMSLSKLGLPGARAGIVVARPDIIEALTEMNAILNLCPAPIGPMLAQDLLVNDELPTLIERHIQPYYLQRSQDALQWFYEAFAGLPAKAHKPEGSIFLWLWFPTLNISSKQLYRRLKKRGVIVVPGEYFFPGLAMDERDRTIARGEQDDLLGCTWPHRFQCLRINIAGDANHIREGLQIIAREVASALPA